jgi:hypothetical protein
MIWRIIETEQSQQGHSLYNERLCENLLPAGLPGFGWNSGQNERFSCVFFRKFLPQDSI